MSFDLQVNGYLGTGFSSPELTVESARTALRQYLANGAERCLPTVCTTSRGAYNRVLPLLAGVLEEPEFADRVPGLHLEGPFLNPAPGAVGAHPPGHVVPPDWDLLRRLNDLAWGKIRLVTIAADQPGAAELCRHCVAAGIVVALGHHLASYDDLCRLRDAGARALTHLGNGLPNQVHRHENPLLAGLACDGLLAMVIADGHHLPAYVVKLVLDCRALEDVIVVSDAAALAGLPPGSYRDGEREVVLEPNGRLWLPSRECLAGSSSTLADCARQLAAWGYPEATIRALTHDNPARLISRRRIVPAQRVPL